jgi:hypothetical protein
MVVNFTIRGRCSWEPYHSPDTTVGKTKVEVPAQDGVMTIDYLFFDYISYYTYKGDFDLAITFNKASSPYTVIEYTLAPKLIEKLQSLNKNIVCMGSYPTKSESYKFEIKPNKKLKLYQFVFYCYGIKWYPALISTSSRVKGELYLEASLTTKILGLSEFNQMLTGIKPLFYNRKEWEAIRDCIVINKDENDSKQFKELLKVMASTKPSNGNQQEWTRIRRKCNCILANWNIYENRDFIQSLIMTGTAPFLDFLHFLTSISPDTNNRREWRIIRKKAQYLCDNITCIR